MQDTVTNMTSHLKYYQFCRTVIVYFLGLLCWGSNPGLFGATKVNCKARCLLIVTWMIFCSKEVYSQPTLFRTSLRSNAWKESQRTDCWTGVYNMECLNILYTCLTFYPFLSKSIYLYSLMWVFSEGSKGFRIHSMTEMLTFGDLVIYRWEACGQCPFHTTPGFYDWLPLDILFRIVLLARGL